MKLPSEAGLEFGQGGFEAAAEPMLRCGDWQVALKFITKHGKTEKDMRNLRQVCTRTSSSLSLRRHAGATPSDHALLYESTKRECGQFDYEIYTDTKCARRNCFQRKQRMEGCITASVDAI